MTSNAVKQMNYWVQISTKMANFASISNFVWFCLFPLSKELKHCNFMSFLSRNGNICLHLRGYMSEPEFPHFLNNWAKLSLVVSKQQGALLKVWLIYSCNLATLRGTLYDSAECFELVIRKNSRSCTHGNYMMLLLISNVCKTFYFCGSLIPSIQCC